MSQEEVDRRVKRVFVWIISLIVIPVALVFLLSELMRWPPHPDSGKTRVFTTPIGDDAVWLHCDIDFSDPESWEKHLETWEFAINFELETTNLFNAVANSNIDFDLNEFEHEHEGVTEVLRSERAHVSLQSEKCIQYPGCQEDYSFSISREVGWDGVFSVFGAWKYAATSQQAGFKLPDYFFGDCKRLSGEGPLYRERYPIE